MSQPDWKKHASDASFIQDAVNPLGVTKGLARAVQSMYDELDRPGFDEFRQNANVRAITACWLVKIGELFGYFLTDEQIAGAYEQVTHLAGEEP